MSNGIVMSADALALIAARAATIHHGRIVIELNADNPRKYDIIVEERIRMRTSEAVDAPPPRPSQGAAVQRGRANQREG